MSDYINRYAVLNVIDDAIANNALSYESCVNEIMESIAKLPAANVRPVVSGEWIDMGDFVQCSKCHVTRLKEIESPYYGIIISMNFKTTFCPNCVAKMEVSEDA